MAVLDPEDDKTTVNEKLVPPQLQHRFDNYLTRNETEFTTDDSSKIGTGAVKYDGGKPGVWRGVINYFPRALWAVGEISTFGANKYAWDGWEGVEDGFARYKDAQFRHALKQAMGEQADPDSKLEHLAHEAWGALATLELHLRKSEK